MKKLLLITGLIVLSTSLFAQEKCKDIIYPADGKSIIFDCCIYEVTEVNIVHYVRDGDTASIAAASIVKDGQEIKFGAISGQFNPSPYQIASPTHYEHDYEYYKRTYRYATNQKNAGIGFTIIGLLLETTGYVLIIDQNNKSAYQYDVNKEKMGVTFVVAGAFFETIGIPLWISGGIKRANNKKTIDAIEKSKNLSFEFTGTGVGFNMKF